jgi:CPA1 family monovalent cation:H+ antiporter
MKDVEVPKRLSTIIEGESLLNDAASLIVFRFALTTIQTGNFVFTDAAASFFIVIIMGIVTGLVVGLVFYAIHRWLPTTPSIDIVLTFVTPYIMYVTAEHFHFSGVLAVVSGGLFLARMQQSMLSNHSRIQGLNVWSIASFVLNGIIFMLIGLQLPVIVSQLNQVTLFDAIKYGLIITGTLIVCRILFSLGASVFTRFISRFIKTADSNPGWRAPLIFGWAGMRGVVSLAAALSIPLYLSKQEAFPYRNLILFITFMVILITLLFQGLTLPLLIRWVKLEETDYPMQVEEQDGRVQKKLAQAALTLLQDRFAEKVASNPLLQGLKIKLEHELKVLDHTILPGIENSTENVAIDEYKEVLGAVIEEQRKLLYKINEKAEISEPLIKMHLLRLDKEEQHLNRELGLDD